MGSPNISIYMYKGNTHGTMYNVHGLCVRNVECGIAKDNHNLVFFSYSPTVTILPTFL